MTVYDSGMARSWRIEELAELAHRALAAAPLESSPSGRVREVPDIRTIRYYTTIGLLDRPAEMRGRTAYYGVKHLRQLVAIKRLQAQGKPLVEIQEWVLGASARQLQQLAALPSGLLDEANLAGTPVVASDTAKVAPKIAAQAAPARAQFWAAAPALAPPKEMRESADAAGSNAGSAAPARKVAVMLPVAKEASLLLEGIAPELLTEEVVASLQPALAALREALRQAGIDSARSSSGNQAGEPGTAKASDTHQENFS